MTRDSEAAGGGEAAGRPRTRRGRSLTRGDRIGGYEIVARIGSGGTGHVYRARDEKLGRDVAIKVLSAEAARDEKRWRRLVGEARAASALAHPNIVAVYEMGEAETGPFLVTELVEGETVRELLHRGPIPVALALDIAIQALSALTRAHRSGILHRDLKPENLMVSREGFVKLLDFGIAKLAREGTAWAVSRAPITLGAPATEQGMVLGTAAYMSPEQARGHTLAPGSDLFSLGVVLYEMVTGRNPFLRGSAVETMSAVIREEAAPLSGADPGGEALGQVLDRALRKTPEERYQDAAEFEAVLRRVRADPGVTGPAGSGSRTLRGKLEDSDSAAGRLREAIGKRSGGSRRRAVAAVALALAAAGVFLVLRSARERAVPAAVGDAGTGGTSDGEARRLYLQGRFAAGQRTEEGIRSAIDFFRQAVERDTRYALAYAGLADGFLQLGDFGGLPARDGALRASSAARRAVDLAPDLAEAHVALASVRLFHERNASAAEKGFQKAIALAPQSAAAHQGLGLLRLSQGRFEEALAEIRRARELDPVSLAIATDLARALFYSRRFDDAIAEYQRVLALDPKFAAAHLGLGLVQLRKENHAAAIAAFRRAHVLSPRPPTDILLRAYEAAAGGRRSEALRIVRQLEPVTDGYRVSPIHAAGLCAFLGQTESAFDWLERGLREGDRDLVFLGVDPIFDILRSDPRFPRQLRRPDERAIPAQ